MGKRKLGTSIVDWAGRISLYAGWRTAPSLATIARRIRGASGIEFVSHDEIPAGWYMVEVQANIAQMRVCASVFTSPADIGKTDERHGLPLYSGRVCKRLIRVRRGRLHVTLPLPSVDLLHFRVVPVTRAFSYSRIVQKLQGAHPRYKASQTQQARRSVANAKNTKHDFKSLWSDYCALFDESPELVSYQDWIGAFESPRFTAMHTGRSINAEPRSSPSIAALVIGPCSDPASIERTVRSFLQQTWSNWHIYLVAQNASDGVKEQPQEWANRVTQIASIGDFNACLPSSDWITVVECGDVLNEQALSEVAEAIHVRPHIQFLYTDEDTIDSHGNRSAPALKPDWNDNLFYASDLFSRLAVFKRELFQRAGGLSSEPHGHARQVLILRCRERIGVDEIYHLPRVLYHRYATGDVANDAFSVNGMCATQHGRALLDTHFKRLDIRATTTSENGIHRVQYALPEEVPSVCLIIPTRNGKEHLRRCMASILGKTTYPDYRVLIVDNGSDDRETLDYLKQLGTNDRVTILRDSRPFNYSALNNVAVASTDAEVVGLINDDVEVIGADWLTEMVSHAMRSEVGVVGAKLLYGDDTIQHAGVVLGIHGVAGHVYRFLHRDSPGYLGQAKIVRAVSAVTGACLIVKRQIYEAVGGLDEELQVACNDVDFCLRVREAGYMNIWTPFAELYHHESTSRGFDVTPEKLMRSQREASYMATRWGDRLLSDPAYNINLSLEDENCGLAWPPRPPLAQALE